MYGWTDELMNEWMEKKRRKYVRHAYINKYRDGWIMDG